GPRPRRARGSDEPGQRPRPGTGVMTARVVITGMGVITANADSARAYANALRDGRSGVRTMRRFDPGWPFREAGEVDLAEADPTLDRVSQLAVSTGHPA